MADAEPAPEAVQVSLQSGADAGNAGDAARNGSATAGASGGDAGKSVGEIVSGDTKNGTTENALANRIGATASSTTTGGVSSQQQDSSQSSPATADATKSAEPPQSQPPQSQPPQSQSPGDFSRSSTDTKPPQTTTSDSQPPDSTTAPSTSNHSSPLVTPSNTPTDPQQATANPPPASDSTPAPQPLDTLSSQQSPSAEPSSSPPPSTSDVSAARTRSSSPRPTSSSPDAGDLPAPAPNATQCDPAAAFSVCAATEFCSRSRFCTAKLADGQACDGAVQCLSGSCESNACIPANSNLTLIFGISSGVLVTLALVYALCRCGRFPWQRRPKDSVDDLDFPWGALHSARTLVARPSITSGAGGSMVSSSGAPSMAQMKPVMRHPTGGTLAQRFHYNNAWDYNTSAGPLELSSATVGGYTGTGEPGSVSMASFYGHPPPAFEPAAGTLNAPTSASAWNAPRSRLHEMPRDALGQVYYGAHAGVDAENEPYETYWPANRAPVNDARYGQFDVAPAELRTQQLGQSFLTVREEEGRANTGGGIYGKDAPDGGGNGAAKPQDSMNGIDVSEEMNYADYARYEAAKAAGTAAATRVRYSREEYHLAPAKPAGLSVVNGSDACETEGRPSISGGSLGSAGHSRNGTAHFQYQPEAAALHPTDLRQAPATTVDGAVVDDAGAYRR